MHKRILLSNLMIIILWLGLALAALRFGSFSSLRLVYCLTVVVLLLAILAAKYRRNPFWFGFAVFGWGYFLIGIGPWTTWIPVQQPGQGTIFQPRVNPLLLNASIFESLASYQTGNLKPPPLASNATASDAVIRNKQLQSYLNALAISTGIGHLIWVWIFGGGGGLIAGYLSSRRDPDTN